MLFFSQCTWVTVKADLDTTHHISELQRICCMCVPAFQQRWAIHQTLAGQTEEKSYSQYLKKETTFCELCVTHQPLSRLTEHNSAGAKATNNTLRKKRLKLTTTKWFQIAPLYHTRPPRILQSGLGRRNVTVKMSIANTFNSVCNKEYIHFINSAHVTNVCQKLLWRYFTRGTCCLKCSTHLDPACITNAHSKHCQVADLPPILRHQFCTWGTSLWRLSAHKGSCITNKAIFRWQSWMKLIPLVLSALYPWLNANKRRGWVLLLADS